MTSSPYLQAGDKVSIVATAKNFEPAALDAAIQTLEGWGLEVVKGKHLFNHYYQFAGTDAQRASDLQTALDDNNIKAIFCARGGYGTARIIDQLNFSKFSLHPKWIIGFSDVTVLLSHLHRLGFESLHAVMPVNFSNQLYAASIQALKKALFGETIQYWIHNHPLNRLGEVSAQVTGGNLTILNNLTGTISDPDYHNKILFIEDVGEHLYHTDRMMVHLKRAKVLKHLKGLLVGHFSDMKDNAIPFGNNAYEIVLDAVKDYDYPVCFGFPAGHAPDNLPLFMGREMHLNISRHETTIAFADPAIV